MDLFFTDADAMTQARKIDIDERARDAAEAIEAVHGWILSDKKSRPEGRLVMVWIRSTRRFRCPVGGLLTDLEGERYAHDHR